METVMKITCHLDHSTFRIGDRRGNLTATSIRTAQPNEPCGIVQSSLSPKISRFSFAVCFLLVYKEEERG